MANENCGGMFGANFGKSVLRLTTVCFDAVEKRGDFIHIS